jgi:hypothetical protein
VVWKAGTLGILASLLFIFFVQEINLRFLLLFIAAQLHANFEDYFQNVLLRRKRSLGDDFSDGNRSGQGLYPGPFSYIFCPG